MSTYSIITRSYSVFFDENKQPLPMAPLPGDVSVEDCQDLAEALRSMKNRLVNYRLSPPIPSVRWDLIERRTKNFSGYKADVMYIFQEPQPKPVKDSDKVYVATRRTFTLVKTL